MSRHPEISRRCAALREPPAGASQSRWEARTAARRLFGPSRPEKPLMSKKQLFLKLCGPSARPWEARPPCPADAPAPLLRFLHDGLPPSAASAVLFCSGAASCGLRRASASLRKNCPSAARSALGQRGFGRGGRGSVSDRAGRAAPAARQGGLSRVELSESLEKELRVSETLVRIGKKALCGPPFYE